MKIAVISDLHVGAATRAADMCPAGVTVRDDMDKKYLDDFRNFVKEERCVADILVISGDISNEAKPEEYALASSVISQVAKALKVPKNRIFFVPGNHDVDWSVLKLGDPGSSLRSQQRYDPIKFRDYIFKKIDAKGNQSYFEEPFINCWASDDALVVGYNSAWHDKPSEKVHHGFVQSTHLEHLEKTLENHPRKINQYRIFIVHHHPIQYSDPMPNEPDWSIMTNAHELVRVLQRHSIDVVIHGHKHCPNFTVEFTDGIRPLPILGAGSFSARLDTRWSGRISNLFHIIELIGRDERDLQAYGYVWSWAYLSGVGWRRSKVERDKGSRPLSGTGIEYEVGFGRYGHIELLTQAIRGLLATQLATNRFARWRDLVANDFSLRHVPPRVRHEALRRLAKELEFSITGEEPDELVFVRPR